MSINKLKEITREFLLEEEGIGVVEIILILVIVIGLVIIFKDRMTALVNSIFSSITSKSNTILR